MRLHRKTVAFDRKNFVLKLFYMRILWRQLMIQMQILRLHEYSISGFVSASRFFSREFDHMTVYRMYANQISLFQSQIKK